jgi:hypothetical protein
MDKYIQIFIDFIPNDKSFVDILMPQYEKEFHLLGYYIDQHSASLSCKDDESMEELYDFLDGNGFEVIYPSVANPFDVYSVRLIPLYERPITKEIEDLDEAIKKIQSTFSEYFPVQETVLSYTSMEDNKRYILEYKKLLASWAFWLRVCRRVELLQLVSESCGRSFTLYGRPP